MNVRSIVKKYLEQHGYAGLRSRIGSCRCNLDNLMTVCNNFVSFCRPYRSDMSEPEDKKLDVAAIVREYLKAHNYEGLRSELPSANDCYCELSNLMTCYNVIGILCKPY